MNGVMHAAVDKIANQKAREKSKHTAAAVEQPGNTLHDVEEG